MRHLRRSALPRKRLVVGALAVALCALAGVVGRADAANAAGKGKPGPKQEVVALEA